MIIHIANLCVISIINGLLKNCFKQRKSVKKKKPKSQCSNNLNSCFNLCIICIVELDYKIKSFDYRIDILSVLNTFLRIKTDF